RADSSPPRVLSPLRHLSASPAATPYPPPNHLHFLHFHDPATTAIYTLSLHDALPISSSDPIRAATARTAQPHPRPPAETYSSMRSEEHTSELQSRENLVCRLLLEKKNTKSKLSVSEHKTNVDTPMYNLSQLVLKTIVS